MNRKNLESKLKSAFSVVALGGALVFSGCGTPNYYPTSNSGYSGGYSSSQVVEVQQPISGNDRSEVNVKIYKNQEKARAAAMAEAGRRARELEARRKAEIPIRELQVKKRFEEETMHRGGSLDSAKSFSSMILTTNLHKFENASYFSEDQTIISLIPEEYRGNNIEMKIKNQNGEIVLASAPLYLEPKENWKGGMYAGYKLDIKTFKKGLLQEGNFEEGQDRKYLVELYVNDEKTPKETKTVFINYGGIEQPSDSNIRYIDKVGKTMTLAYRYAKDFNNNGIMDYPEDFSGITNRFNFKDLSEFFVYCNYRNKKFPYVISKLFNPDGREILVKTNESTTAILNFAVVNGKNELFSKDGSYKFAFYAREKLDSKDIYVTQKEIEVLNSGKD